MENELLILHKGGWACTNEAKLDKHYHKIEGTKLKAIPIISIVSIYDAIGKLEAGTEIECVINIEDKLKGFFGIFENEKKIIIKGELGTEEINKLINKINKDGRNITG